MMRGIAMVGELLLSLFADVNAMPAACEARAPGFQELPVLIEDDNGILAGAAGMYRVRHIDVAFCILATPCVSPQRMLSGGTSQS